jgi:hypothetical protein
MSHARCWPRGAASDARGGRAPQLWDSVEGQIAFVQSHCDLTGLIRRFRADFGMRKTKPKARPTRRARKRPLADGQVWRMAELNLKVESVGKLLVHYKLAKPNAIRMPNLVNSIATIQKYLKKNKAVLVRG